MLMSDRFMMKPRPDLDADNLATSKTIDADLDQLSKKAKYLEKQFNEANGQLRDIVSSSFLLSPCSSFASHSSFGDPISPRMPHRSPLSKLNL